MTLRPCLIIPNYNHGYALTAIVGQVEPLGIPLIVVNDCSTDDTRQIIEELQTRHPWIHALHRPVNGGKGAAIRDGLHIAAQRGFSHALCIDGDGQHDTSDTPRFLEAAHTFPDHLILGTPCFGPDAPLARRLGREISNAFVAIATWSLFIRDSLCGFRIYPLAPVLAAVDLNALQPRMGFDVEILVRLVWSGMRVKNIPTRVTYPPHGRSHFRYGRDNAHLTRLLTVLVLQGLLRGPRRIWRATARPRTDRLEWHAMAERGSLTGLRLLLKILLVAGRPILLTVMAPVVLYMFICGRAARTAAVAFQRRVLRVERASDTGFAVWVRAWKQFWSFGVAIVDKVVSWRSPLPLSSFVWSGRDEVKARLARGQGVIFMSAHVGNVEVIRSLGDQRNVVIHALMYTGNSPHFRAFLEEVNKRSFVRVHDLSTLNTSLVFELQAALERGEVVALLADRVPKLSAGRSVSVPFLGSAAQFPQGPWILASMLEAPVYSVFSMRDADGRYRVEFTQLTEQVVLPRAGRSDAIAAYAQSFADALAATIMRYPTQWYNFFEFW